MSSPASTVNAPAAAPVARASARPGEVATSARAIFLGTKPWATWWQYAVALGAIGIALAARWLMQPVVQDRVPYITLFIVLLPLVLLVRPRVFFAAAVMGLIGSWYLFVPPPYSVAGIQLALYGLAVAGATFAAWLSHRMHRRSIALAERAELERREADRRKDEFIAMLAHELRNPLAPIQSAGLLLNRNLAPERLDWCREVIERQTAQMKRILDDLLDISLISRGKMVVERRSTPLASMLETAAETADTSIRRRSQELVLSLPRERIFVDADPFRLTQVFVNLFINAAKYSEERTVIRVAVERSSGSVRISVRDQGIGIAPENLSTVFDPFWQAGAPLDRAQSGLGIGLALVRKLVELHGGTVSAHSEGLGKGSEFAVTLPVARTEQPTATV